MNRSWIVIIEFALLVISWNLDRASGLTFERHELVPGKEFHLDDSESGTMTIHIFCRSGDPKAFTNYFKSATLRIISSADDVRVIKGYSVSNVLEVYSQTSRFSQWAANLLPWKIRETTLPTFNSTCAGVVTRKPYSAMLIIRPIDSWSFLTLLAGIGIFFLAPKLSTSTPFFYTSGTLVGALGFAVILLFILSRFLPKRPGSYTLLGVIWFAIMFVAGETFNRFTEILREKLPYIIVYLTLGCVVSFFVCYRYGPPSHPKTINLMRWCLKAFGLFLIHLSSDFIEVSTTIIICLVLYPLIMHNVIYKVQTFWRRRFPPKPKLLTEEEYIRQGAEETVKQLDELRKFCNSPECKPWKLVTTLKNPRRFSSFMEGDSHLSDTELMDYESDSDSQSLNQNADENVSDDNDDQNAELTEDEETEISNGAATNVNSNNPGKSSRSVGGVSLQFHNGPSTSTRSTSQNRSLIQNNSSRPSTTKSNGNGSLVRNVSTNSLVTDDED